MLSALLWLDHGQTQVLAPSILAGHTKAEKTGAFGPDFGQYQHLSQYQHLRQYQYFCQYQYIHTSISLASLFGRYHHLGRYQHQNPASPIKTEVSTQSCLVHCLDTGNIIGDRQPCIVDFLKTYLWKIIEHNMKRVKHERRYFALLWGSSNLCCNKPVYICRPFL